MKTTLPALLSVLAAAVPTGAVEGVISLPLRRSVGVAQARRHRARDITPVDLIDLTIAYSVDLGIGIPPQRLALVLDTGSTSTWVNPSCEWARNRQLCEGFPRYDPAASETPARRVPQIDGYQDYYSGDWALMQGYSDIFWWGNNSRVDDQWFGVANETDGSNMGFVGVGPDLEHGFDPTVTNHTVLSTIARQGVIKSRAFSLGVEANLVFGGDSPGSLILGGVDKNSFTGKLFKLPILEPGKGGGDAFWRYWVTASGVTHKVANGTVIPRSDFTGNSSIYLVDSGTTGVYLPRDVVQPIMRDIGLRWTPGSFPSINCERRADNGSFVFSFGDNIIEVPYSAFVLENTPGTCLFLLTSVESNAVDLHILGLSFLRGAYAVFDWDNREIQFAQRKDCGAPDLVAIEAGPSTSIEGNCK